MSNYLWIIDAGHGGIDAEGKYVTAPAKMHTFPDGLTIYEGVINRKIANAVHDKLLDSRIDLAFAFHQVLDWPLKDRVFTADAVYRHNKNAILVSIHSNASPDHNGSGFEIFTSPGQTKSDKIANLFCETYKKHFYDYKLRWDYADGDADKEADYYILRKTDCPAILIENLFFDNRYEAEFLLSGVGQHAIADCIVDAIMTVEKLKPI